MSGPRARLLAVGLLFAVLLGSTAFQANPPATPPPVRLTPTRTPTLLVGAIPTVTFTPTPSPVLIPIPTATPSPTTAVTPQLIPITAATATPVTGGVIVLATPAADAPPSDPDALAAVPSFDPDADAASAVLPTRQPTSEALATLLPTAVPAGGAQGQAANLERVPESYRPTLAALLTAVPYNGRQGPAPTRAVVAGLPTVGTLANQGADSRIGDAAAGAVLPPPRGADGGATLLASIAATPTRQATAVRIMPTAAVVASDRPESDARGPRYAGWATMAYPWMSFETMLQVVARQKAAGANVIWIGHNNPGEVSAQGQEPGLSYAVFEALMNPDDPRRDDALAIVEAQERMLRAVRTQRLKAVLPIGYQSQMGGMWDGYYPDSLRLESRGGVNYTTAVSNASFYSKDYRRDIRQYYEWIDARFVRPFRDTLLMINLADEPSGGDYSTWADEAFLAKTGYRFSDVGTNPDRLVSLGEFQSKYIAEYATWSAQQWQELEPDLPVTMSFEGATARIHLQLPHVESLFARTPPNFVPTFDAYPRDGPPDMPIDDAELVKLFNLTRSLGYYSARYNRPFWLWSTGNSWGLAQASPQPANVADAVANGYYLAMLARQTGGWLQGIAVWNYNVVGQGLYNDTHRTNYDPDVMFARVSESFPRLRQIMASPAGAARVLALAPDRLAWRLMGASRDVDPFRLRTFDLHRLIAPARNNVPLAVVGNLTGADLGRIDAIIVLARAPFDLADEDVTRLRTYLAAGGKVVALRGLSTLLGAGVDYVDGDRVEEVFTEPGVAERQALWQRILGIDQPVRNGYTLATAEDALAYTLGGALQAELRLPFSGRGWSSDSGGYLLARLQSDGVRVSVRLDKNQYAYLSR